MENKNKGFMIICKNCKNHIDIYSYSDLRKAMNGKWAIKFETSNEWSSGEILCYKCRNIVDEYTPINENHKQ